MNHDAAWRSTNIGTLLFAASGRVIDTKLAVIRARGFPGVTEPQLALFHHIEGGDTRLTTLAARARLSKARMVDLVDRAEASGLVTRQRDPGDGRVRIVMLMPTGHALMAALDAGTAAAEQDVAGVVGPETVAALKDGLGRYIATPATAARVLVPAGSGAEWAAANVGRLFALAAQRFTQDVASVVQAEGFDASDALLGMIRNLDLNGARLTDIAARGRTTKQSMRELVERAEALGFVMRCADPDDRRAKTIVFTARGRKLLDAARRGVGAAEASLAAIASTAFVEEARTTLTRFIAA